jgi:Methyltransferase FkbM domain
MGDWLRVYHLPNKKRLGREFDGGYIIADLSDNTKPVYDLYIGCGINDEFSFDVDLANIYPNLFGYAFDGTIKERPATFPDKFAFIPLNIGNTNDEATTTLVPYMRLYNDILLKMDIEGAEWEWLDNLPIPDLLRIKQIVIEIHYLIDGRCATAMTKLTVLKKLADYFYLVHVHGNNHSPLVDDKYPYVLECTYVRKDVYPNGLPLNTESLPGNLDMPNYPHAADIDLNYWPFVSSQE